MAEEGSKWVVMVTGRSPTNIAVIKYWGKRDEALILPINDSISLTLDPIHLSATTTVAVSPSFSRDRMWLNGKEIPLSGERYQKCLREIRKRANEVSDEKQGIKIKKEDWERLHVHISSYNNFPTAAGLASSAAGFACLVYTLAKLMNVKEDLGQISSIARQGSGSACRSLYGGFVKWAMGNNADGSDSLAIQLADETHWTDLVVIIAVVSSKQKETSSTSGMRETVQTSALINHRAETVVPARVLKMEEAIKNRDFASFAKLACTDSNQFHAVCLDTSPPIFYMNDTSHRIINLVEKWNHSEGTPQVAYTFDAGPNAVLISPNRKTAALLLQRLLFQFPPNQDTDLSRHSMMLVFTNFGKTLVSDSSLTTSGSIILKIRFVVGDKSILQDAGVTSMKDIETLEPPTECKDKVPYQRFTGDVSYFICTRVGSGPKVLTDETLALLDPITGLPK